MEVFSLLLGLHITAGFTALLAALVAVASKSTQLPHRWHVISGSTYCLGMTVIFLTALPMSIMRNNQFLLLISIFSFYFAFSGWRYGRNRAGTPHGIDWLAAGLLGACSLGMLGYGAYLLLAGDNNGITIAVFGGIAAATSISDLRRMRAGGARGRRRIANHLGAMLGGTIAAITAFVVTNFTMEPMFVLWLAPTVVITPVIAWWSRKVLRGDPVSGL